MSTGTNRHKIAEKVQELIYDQQKYLNMSEANNPFGNGMASSKIVEILINSYGL